MSFNEWEKVSLKEIIMSISETYKLKSEKVVLVNTSDVLEGKVLNHKWVENGNLKGQFKKSFRKNDILYSEIRPQNKRFAYIDFEPKDYIASTKLMVLRKKSDRIDNKFLFQLLKSDLFIRNLQNIAETRSGTFPQITFSELGMQSINLPSLKEQEAIAHILYTIDEKIEVNNRINKTLEDMAQAIFKRWFVDFEYPNEDGEPYKSSDGEMILSELGLIPLGWEIKKFEEVFYFQEGPGIRNWQYVDKGTKFINIRCINGNDLHLGTANMISDAEAEGKYKHFMIDAGDIVMSTSGTLGKYAIVREDHLPLCLNTSVIRFKPLNDSEHYSFMYAYITSNEFFNHLITKASGSVQKNFGPMHLRQINLVYPNNGIIKQLNSIISPVIKLSLHTKKENDTLKSMRDTLLPKLMSGEIQLSEENK